jgi:hypothetical protein
LLFFTLFSPSKDSLNPSFSHSKRTASSDEATVTAAASSKSSGCGPFRLVGAAAARRGERDEMQDAHVVMVSVTPSKDQTYSLRGSLFSILMFVLFCFVLFLGFLVSFFFCFNLQSS